LVSKRDGNAAFSDARLTVADDTPKEPRSVDPYDEFVPFYDLCYPDRQAEIAFYVSLLRPGDRSVLELGCGTGTIAAALERELARRATPSRAVGLDRSSEMLKWARSRHPAVEWVHGDMTDPPIEGPFDLIVCAFNMQMLESDAAVLKTITAARHLLGPRGRFVVDLYNASYEAPSDAAANVLDRVVRSFNDANGHMLEIREKATDIAGGGAVRLDWTVMDMSTLTASPRARLVVELRHYSSDALDRLIAQAGLRSIDRFGDVSKATFDSRRSKKQVVVCSL
jgi:ubiquinone/menaquinone biosynthesis C-methylase UbiE